MAHHIPSPYLIFPKRGVTTAIRYGHSADACTLTSAPNYTEAGNYTVYYKITYTYADTDMVEDGVAYVHLLPHQTVPAVVAAETRIVIARIPTVVEIAAIRTVRIILSVMIPSSYLCSQ